MNIEDWFANVKNTEDYKALERNPIAYFSAEYALDSALPTYAGGLGVLAGDYIHETVSHTFPLIAIGLRYHNAQHSVISMGAEIEEHIAEAKLVPLIDAQGVPVVISLPIGDRIVHAKAFIWNNFPLYFLDTNIEANHPDDRSITQVLYVEDRTLRLKQEILLGIGGFRLLKRLGHHPSVYHLNEGHSAFLGLELAHHEMEHRHVDFKTACDYAKKHVLFTNHTLVPAGQEQFSLETVTSLMKNYAEEIGVATYDIAELGKNGDAFSMTTLAFRLSSKANAVSVLHGQKAKILWPEHPMEAITNGIYLPRWDKIGAVSAEDIFKIHQTNKTKLLKYIFDITGETWHEDELLIGWARRTVDYKQPLAFFSDIARLQEIISKSHRSVRIVFSGPTENGNENANTLVAMLRALFAADLKGIAVFLPNYNLDIASLMTSGTDIWLNTPMIGSEACGTSGMKALLNGSLPLSTRDGWIAEVAMENIGWIIDEPNIGSKLLDVVEQEIIPTYYAHIKNQNESDWIKRMKAGRELILEKFSASRMLRAYIEEGYIPLLHQHHKE
ncbi:alpha-glucan family phosphorylase [Candidatus Nomurabacteria bacterium]|jgi:starch phosphorylase|nr:MAG: alpha-glucan family phosphorylase [Candidatus Nomurabacteria bacterium]